MITIELLKNHPNLLEETIALWYSEDGKNYFSSIPYATISSWFYELRSDALPIGYIALDNGKVIGCASLRSTDDICPNLTPWLADVVVHPDHRNQGIANRLIETVKNKAASLGYPKLYLYAFKKDLVTYYAKRGWKTIGHDTAEGHPVTVMEIDLATDDKKEA